MGMFDKFPYRNTRDLNLNWIIKKIIYLEGVVGKAVSDVATFLSKKGGKMEGPIDMQSNRIFNLPTPAGDADAATKKYVDDHSGGVSEDYLPLAGGTMTGSINMNGQHISGLNDPSEDTQAARKGYVDAAKAEAIAYTDTKADLPKTVSGTVVSLSDASSGNLQGMRIYGRTTQNGTPTPDNPVPLVSVGDGGSVGVTIAGKNLLSYPYYQDTSTQNGGKFTVNTDRGVSLSGTPTGYSSITLYSGPALGCGTFTYSISGNMEGVVILFTLYNNKITDGVEPPRKSEYEVTFNTDDYPQYTKWACGIKRKSNGMEMTGTAYPQLELGSIATDYKPYTAQTLSISTPNGLPGIPVTSGGNYTDANGQQWICDEVDFARGTYLQRIGTIDSYASEAVSEPYLSTTGALSTGAKVLYVLSTPIETQIPANELAAYAAMHTNKPNTTIYNDAGAHMDVGYYTPNSTMRQSDIEKSMSEKLSKTGGTMSGAVNMGGNKITSVADPEAAQDVATKKYVDNHSGGGVSGDYLPLAGGTMSGAVNMGNQKITNVPDPTADQDVATKKYVDEHGISSSVEPFNVEFRTAIYSESLNVLIFHIPLPFVYKKFSDLVIGTATASVKDGDNTLYNQAVTWLSRSNTDILVGRISGNFSTTKIYGVTVSSFTIQKIS